MGGWDTNWNLGALERIVVVLFALANLCELAAGAPLLRRRRALGVLSLAEIKARAFVTGTALDAPGEGDICHAMHLAERFRALARMLCLLIARLAIVRRAGRPGASRRICVWTAGHRPATPVTDTS